MSSAVVLPAVLQRAPVATALLDASGRILAANPAFERLLGVSAALPPELGDVRALFSGARESLELERSLTGPGGEELPVRVRAWLVPGGHEGGDGVVVQLDPLSREEQADRILEQEVERISDGFIVYDRNWRYRYLNPAAEEYLGKTREELLGKVLWDVYPAAVGTVFQNALIRAAVHNEPVEFEISSPVFRRWVAYKAFPSPGGVSLHFRDVSAHKEVEAALRDSENRYRSVYENSLDAIFLTAPTGEIFAANPAACAMLGRTEEEICKLGRDGVVDPADPRLPALLQERLLTGRARGELSVLRKDGTRFPADVTSAVFRDAHGKERTTITIHDLTERKRSETGLKLLAETSALSSSLDVEQTLRDILRLVVPGLAEVCIVDRVDDELLRRVMVVHGEAVSERQTVRPLAPPGRRPEVGVDAVLHSLQPEVVPVMSEEWLRKATRDEEHFREAMALGLTSALMVPMLARNRPVGVLTLGMVDPRRRLTADDLPLAQGLADRAALAIDNARLYSEAVAARALRDEMLAIVSHDLRTPLHTIGLCTTILLKQGENRELISIQRSVERAERLIDDLLTAAAIEGGKLPLQARDTQIPTLVADVVELHRDLARSRSIELSVSVESTVTTACIDRDGLLQLLSNLLGNALKFTPPHGRVSLQAQQDEQNVVFTVEDTGPGIAPDQMPHLFDRYWQGTRARRAGVGLGLAIVKGIADAHGGTVRAESLPGSGARFVVTIPCKAEASTGPAQTAGPSSNCLH